jgi:hypothetical protein
MLRNKQTRIGLGFAAVMVALTLLVAVLTTGGAAALLDSQEIHIDDPDNETVEATVDFSGSTDVTVNITNDVGEIDSQTLSGTDGDTLTATLDPSALDDSENVTLHVDATDDTVASLNSTSLTKERTVEVTDAANETLTLDVSFASSTNASADVTVTDSADAELFTDSISYVADDYADNATTVTQTYHDSHGLLSANVTVSLTVHGASAYNAAYAQVNEESTTTSGGLLGGGDIFGQDPTVAAVVGLVLIGGFYYAREEDYL